jgi:hypothetical protein
MGRNAARNEPIRSRRSSGNQEEQRWRAPMTVRVWHDTRAHGDWREEEERKRLLKS